MWPAGQEGAGKFSVVKGLLLLVSKRDSIVGWRFLQAGVQLQQPSLMTPSAAEVAAVFLPDVCLRGAVGWDWSFAMSDGAQTFIFPQTYWNPGTKALVHSCRG